MIDKSLFQLMLDKLNDETINTKGVKYKGNYVMVRVNDNTQFLSTTTYNPYDVEDVDFTATAEVVSNETPYVEENNRSGWIKRYAFEFDYRDMDNNLEVLQAIRDYFFANTVQSIVDNGTTYKMNVKVSRPMFISNRQGAGTIFTSYYIDFFADMLETGFYGNEATHKMRTTEFIDVDEIIVGESYTITSLGSTDWEVVFGVGVIPIVGFTSEAIAKGTGTGIVQNAKQNIISDSITISSATAVNPSNLLTDEQNTDNEAIARGITFQFIVNYDGTLLNDKIMGVIEGDESRETVFEYEKVFNSKTKTYNVLITGGSVVYKKGVVIQLKFNGVQTNV